MPYNFNAFKQKTKEIEEWLAREFTTIRTGRASPALLDSVQVESYGAKVPLRQVASISVEDPRTLKLTLWDKSQQKSVESAVTAANLGVSIGGDSSGVRIIFPELTADKRKVLLKLANENWRRRKSHFAKNEKRLGMIFRRKKKSTV